MTPAKNKPAAPSSKSQQIVFLFTNLLYLVATHFLSLTLYPVGPEFKILAGEEPGRLAAMAHGISRVFGDHLVAYHVLNLALLYACMVCILYLTRAVLQGPWWLGSLAAVLVMANPLKNSQVLMITAAPGLFAQFLALLTLTLYAQHTRGARAGLLFASYASLAAATLLDARAAALALVLVVFEIMIVPDGRKRFLRLLPFILVVAWESRSMFAGVVDFFINPAPVATALWLPFYPIGLLPETVARIDQFTLGWWCVLGIVMFVLHRVYRWSGHRLIPAMTLSALLLGIAGSAHVAPPTYMQTQGFMLVTMALLAIAVAAVCQRVLAHPKWRIYVVHLTTMLCLLLFALQISSILEWRNAGRQVKLFQEQSRLTEEENPGETLAYFPAFNDVPLMLRDSVSHDTPFSTARDSVMPIAPVPTETPR